MNSLYKLVYTEHHLPVHQNTLPVSSFQYLPASSSIFFFFDSLHGPASHTKHFSSINQTILDSTYSPIIPGSITTISDHPPTIQLTQKHKFHAHRSGNWQEVLPFNRHVASCELHPGYQKQSTDPISRCLLEGLYWRVPTGEYLLKVVYQRVSTGGRLLEGLNQRVSTRRSLLEGLSQKVSTKESLDFGSRQGTDTLSLCAERNQEIQRVGSYRVLLMPVSR